MNKYVLKAEDAEAVVTAAAEAVESRLGKNLDVETFGRVTVGLLETSLDVAERAAGIEDVAPEGATRWPLVTSVAALSVLLGVLFGRRLR